ncbi:hypothetical protein Tco_0544890 [Tanacetum coccineum]
MAQHVLPTAQLVPQYKPIRRCSNYAVLQSIPCSPECKIVGMILLDHCLSHALTATADILDVYLQQFWWTVSKVPDTKDTIKFMLDTQQFTYTVDMFYDTLYLPVETPENSFVAPANINTIETFMNRVGYQGVVNKKFPNIPKRLEEDYHSIKDDVPLVSVYTIGNVLIRGMLISDALLIAEIRETNDFKEYDTVFMKFKENYYRTPSIPPPGDDRERDAIAKATLLSLTLHKTALLAEAQENIAKVQEKQDEEEIDKLVDGDDDDESSTSAFADFKNDKAIEKEKEVVEIVKETNVDDEMKKKDEEVEKEKQVVEIVKETNVDDTSAKKHNEVVMEKDVVDMSGSQEIRKEQKQTPTPSPIRSTRNDLSSDKTISEELANTVTPITATSSKTPSTTTRQKKSFTAKTRRLPRKVIQHCDEIIPELTVTKTNEMLKKEMPRLVKLAVNKNREVSPVDISGMVFIEFAAHGPKLIEELFRKHMQNTTLNRYPKTKSSTATTSSVDLQQQLYLSMQTKPQDQAVDPEIWELLKAKFEKP